MNANLSKVAETSDWWHLTLRLCEHAFIFGFKSNGAMQEKNKHAVSLIPEPKGKLLAVNQTFYFSLFMIDV